MRVGVRLVAGGLLIVLAAACSGGADDTTTTGPETTTTIASTTVPGAPPTIVISNFAFTPDRIVVRQGDTVTWENSTTTGHTSTSADDVWGSDVIAGGGTFEVTFDEVGLYAYFCAIHPSMTGTIEVTG